jgi:phosphoribosyl 1,2-cyclic phosphodiesterase
MNLRDVEIRTEDSDYRCRWERPTEHHQRFFLRHWNPVMNDSRDQACIQLSVLGSSSAGNCTLIWNGHSALLVDCGFPPGYIINHLTAYGLSLDDLRGVLITHTHGDHVCSPFVRRLIDARVPMFCPEDIALHLQGIYQSMTHAAHRGLLKPFRDGVLELDPFQIRSFPVPHDSPGGCFGYSIFADSGGREKKITIATDLAYTGKDVVSHFADSDILVIESNHDVRMLEESGRPIWLKRRIREHAHLSNKKCADFVIRVLERSRRQPSSIMLAHISQECNTREMALECTGEVLDQNGFNLARLGVSHRYRRSEVLKA